jgi:hypothetical protein
MEHFLKDFKEKNGRDATQEDYTKFLQEMYPEN